MVPWAPPHLIWTALPLGSVRSCSTCLPLGFSSGGDRHPAPIGQTAKPNGHLHYRTRRLNYKTEFLYYNGRPFLVLLAQGLVCNTAASACITRSKAQKKNDRTSTVSFRQLSLCCCRFSRICLVSCRCVLSAVCVSLSLCVCVCGRVVSCSGVLCHVIMCCAMSSCVVLCRESAVCCWSADGEHRDANHCATACGQ